MTASLKARIEALRDEIAQADPDIRDDLIEHLEQAVRTLETHGEAPPDWARQTLADRDDDPGEDVFDNMPV